MAGQPIPPALERPGQRWLGERYGVLGLPGFLTLGGGLGVLVKGHSRGADMLGVSFGPTRGASEDAAWPARPIRAVVVRLVVFLGPVVASYGAARIAAPGLWRPAGGYGVAAHVGQVAVVGIAAAVLSERALRRLLPLASLFNLTLVFPDRAPSRFGLALRSGTVRHLQRGSVRLSSDHQQAAEELVAMVTALGRHERLTRGHTERVRAHADLIAQQLGLSERDRSLLSWGALAHDVGKLTVPAQVLSSDGRPTDDEWQVLRQHPAAGGEMVEPLAGWLGEWRLAAAQHHERWDGQGYPAGLSGTEISLAGRIVAVADAFDVITSKRSYKEAMSLEAARAEMVRCAGTQFDPTVVRALLEASLDRSRSRFGFLGWVGELGGWSALPRGVAQVVTATLTAGAVLVAAANRGPVTTDPVEPDQLALTAPATDPNPDRSPEQPPGRDTTGSGDGSTTTTTGSADALTTVTTRSAGLDESDPDQPDQTNQTTPPSGDDANQPSTPGAPTTAADGSTTLARSGASTTTGTVSTTTTTAAPTTTTTAAPTTTTATTTTTTTTTAPAAPSTWDLGNPGTGNTTSQALLPLAGGNSPGSLPNYDTDRDSDPGLLVAKGEGLSETDVTKMQRWSSDAGDTRLQATVTLDLWIATKNFDTGKTGRLIAGLYDCNESAASCNLLGSNTAQFNQAPFGSDFGQITIALGTIDHTFAANRTLVLKIATTNASDDDLWLAYGTTTYPTRLNT
ncbi:MAG: HD-GYP domain-containing protein [Acidimicrobiia bacterium]|nr:HD-GYP domain-containing protein [Acidimicrobiia bacterium]